MLLQLTTFSIAINVVFSYKMHFYVFIINFLSDRLFQMMQYDSTIWWFLILNARRCGRKIPIYWLTKTPVYVEVRLASTTRKLFLAARIPLKIENEQGSYGIATAWLIQEITILKNAFTYTQLSITHRHSFAQKWLQIANWQLQQHKNTEKKIEFIHI